MGVVESNLIPLDQSIIGRRVIALINIEPIDIILRTAIGYVITDHIQIIIIIQIGPIIVGVGRVGGHGIVQHLKIIVIIGINGIIILPIKVIPIQSEPANPGCRATIDVDSI